MAADQLREKASIELTVAHLLVVWDICASKLSGSAFLAELSDTEKRAIWALEDLCEAAIVDVGIKPRPEPDWDALMHAARAEVSRIPVEFLP